MEQLARQLARVAVTAQPEISASVPLVGLLARNAGFLAIVLSHGFRRLLPPF
jgi:ADP-ribosyl-[dinitrogen reductase] hydrolase